ncbi:DUF3895 domain-containing protein [Paenibacillus xylaniclasticus]|uniref:DUF3895 domain-containing protein n=1 Tax=Paenibacillus xylaniclasticus TaxID=588083 RepID=UPI000FDC5B74|nr:MULTISPECIES: DUF3895 domain-containing protein [Paenibacillus]GFN31730.1 hypothetical protein PCURB6_19900 [Paenibacillus curdlanolyticus]
MILDVEVRDTLMSRLNDIQRHYLTDVLVRGRRTAFANAMARQKGHYIPDHTDVAQVEQLLDDWIYTGYIDAGKVTPELRCECGRPLRYQHQVEHKVTGHRKHFGIEHLKEHLSIDAAAVAAIKKGFDAVDYELDELLVKISSGWSIDPELLQLDPLPDDIRKHLELELPLLDKQISRLRQMHAAATAASRNYRQSAVHERKPVMMLDTAEETFDLFDWQQHIVEEPAGEEPSSFELDYKYHSKVKAYLQSGIQSARVICELLIEEHGASSRRFLTGKPKLYMGVCLFIESLNGYKLLSMSSEDRNYGRIQA